MSALKQRFHLSPQGTLRLAIASLCLLPPLALANGITGVDGPGGTPQLHNQGGVPIVNIVAPNAAGLSHNQFLDYNVDRQGVVLNNALQAGQSQLAGQLAANPQLRSQAARVILNEVIGRNASALNGAQEIFGHKADYVLANPNGISVNGARFINTPTASLVVGRPELDSGALHALTTGDARGQLNVVGQGLDNPDGAIRLIAPRIDSQGRISARDDLDIIAGRNRVDAASAQVNAVYASGKPSAGLIDASLFGAMKAGRINIVSTAEGAGVHIGAVQVAGTEGVSLRSGGDLQINGQTYANSLEATRAEVHSSRGDVSVQGAGDVTLAGVDISAGNIKLDAGRNLTLSSLQSEALEQKREQWQHKALFVTYETFDRTRTEQDSRQHGTQVTARHNALLSSGNATLLKASNVEAGDTLRINSGTDLRLDAATETRQTRDQGHHRKHLWREDWDTTTRDERNVTSSLKAGKAIELTSAQKLQMLGAELHTPGDIQLSAREVEIASVSRNQGNSGKRYSGDLTGGSFFATKGDSEGDKTLHTGSRVNAGDKLTVRADDVHISASQVRGGTQASVISDRGSLVIDGVQDTSRDSSHNKDSKFFALINDETRKSHSERSIVASDLHSDSNLTLHSGKDITVSGSRVSAAGLNKVQAQGDINLIAAQNASSDSTRTDKRGFTASARETAPGSREYRVDAGLNNQQSSRVTETTLQQGASLSGGQLAVNSGGDLSIIGSDLNATQGDVNLKGSNINLLAAHERTDQSGQELSTGGGIVWTASLDKVGSGLEFVRQNNEDTNALNTARVSTVTATGNVQVSADNALVNQGGQMDAGNGLQIDAKRVDNLAVHDSESSTQSRSGWQAGLGVSAEIKGLSRPLDKIVNNVSQGKSPQSGLLDGIGLASVGLDGTVGYSGKSGTQQDSSAVVSQLSGRSVNLNVGGKLVDQGTQYLATDGALSIKAGSHDASVALNTRKRTEQDVEAKAGLRVYTTTGEDVNVRANGSGKLQQARETASTVQVARYAGAKGVNIDVAGDAVHEGGDFDGGTKGVNLNAGGRLAFNPAIDSRSQSALGLSGNASLSLKTGEDSSLTPGGGLKFDIQPKHSESSDSHLATFRGQGRVQLTGATVSGDLLKGQGGERQSLQAGIDQPIN
ncbi:hemagglutination [Pseudomonas fragi]|uniref:Hemagglutination n=1 Tax=Pseudomonas fragi TaxID=296 RepID=A0A266LR11_PSEFR|nr:hemagglutinin repeat-containing protein [Pseudomonas fragi]OZY40453.1 hemagglutination [Pseudomonas fragi]